MITEFGKILRMYRIQNGLILKDMADKLEIPSSYLSAVEMGRKNVSSEFITKLLSKYDFDLETRQKLSVAAEKSQETYKINTKTVDAQHKELAFSFARKFEELDADTITKILELIK